MKNETIVKVLSRYAKSLDFMAKECLDSEKTDKQHYLFDKAVFEKAVELINKNKEEKE